MRIKTKWILGLSACLFGCLDLGLRDEVRWLDGDSDPDDGQLEEGALDAKVSQGGAGGGGLSEPLPDPDDETGPIATAPACAGKELLLQEVCAAVGPVSAAVRVSTDEPAQVLVAKEAAVKLWALSPAWATEHEVVISGLNGMTAIAFELADASGNESTVSLELEPSPGPAVVITEVLADPTGPEPAQEFVEIANLGAEAVELTGWTIDDNGDNNGDELPSGAILPPGGVALIVAPDFDPDLADGGALPKEALIFRLGSSIGTNGLKNSEAETVELRDASGVEVSVFPGDVAPKPGASAQRRDPFLPEGGPNTFVLALEPSPGAL